MQHDRNPVSNVSSQCKNRLDTVNLVDFQCNANWVYTQNHAEPRGSITYHHISSHIITYHHVIPRFPGNDHWKAHRQPSRAAHCIELAATTRPSRGQHGQRLGRNPCWPRMTRVDPGTFMASWERLKTQLNQLTSWVLSCRSPQGVHSIQMYTAYKDNMKGACQRLTLLG